MALTASAFLLMSLTDGERRTQDLASDRCLWGPAPGDFSGLCYPSAPAASAGMHPESASGPKSQDGTRVPASTEAVSLGMDSS